MKIGIHASIMPHRRSIKIFNECHFTPTRRKHVFTREVHGNLYYLRACTLSRKYVIFGAVRSCRPLISSTKIGSHFEIVPTPLVFPWRYLDLASSFMNKVRYKITPASLVTSFPLLRRARSFQISYASISVLFLTLVRSSLTFRPIVRSQYIVSL